MESTYKPEIKQSSPAPASAMQALAPKETYNLFLIRKGTELEHKALVLHQALLELRTRLVLFHEECAVFDQDYNRYLKSSK